MATKLITRTDNLSLIIAAVSPVTQSKLDTFVHFSDSEEKYRYNRRLFKIVAPRYNQITRLLSFNRDKTWKRRMIRFLPNMQAPRIADLACGTGDLTKLLHKRYPDASVMGIDITLDMLHLARNSFYHPNLHYCAHDMSRLAFRSESVDIITGGYALRNAPSLPDTFREISRVLKPGGLALFLDFARPSNQIHAQFHLALLEFWGSIWGIIIHQNPHVYAYIARSLRHYPPRKELALMAEKEQLKLQKAESFFFGYVDILVFQKEVSK
ncbi:MAG: methyltransferase domain-containing protein [Chitinivibrionales bacterium]|nr:methyltransferase domain-containing protein [Chitinivibrionales bacterium]